MQTIRNLAVAIAVVSLFGCNDSVPPYQNNTPDASQGGGGGGTEMDGSTSCSAGGNTSGAPVVCPGAMSNPTLPTLLPACTLPDVPACTDARCVPLSLLPEGTNPDDLAGCDSNGSAGKCVPDPFVATQGEFLLSRCTSAEGTEGRCLSPCVPEVAANQDLLIQDICQDGWLCSPCVDDQGNDTGACTQGCDPGPSGGDMTCGGGGGGEVGDVDMGPPPELATCCGELGLCLASDLVPEANRGQLGMLECSGGELCVPTALASGTPTPCRSFGALRAEGRCLPACLPDIADQADTLDQGLCDPGFLCAPCYDPRDGTATGACSLNGDAPMEPAKTFPACCENQGLCVTARAAGEDAAGLSARDCTEGLLCAPEVAVNDPDNFHFPACTIPAKMVELDLFGTPIPITIPASPGACVPNCFMADRDQNLLKLLDLLFPTEADNPCPVNQTCAPCTNPLDGMDTGACR